MVSAAIARNIVGIIGNVISFGLFFSPAPIFYEIIKKKDVEGLKPELYTDGLLSYALWVFYGMPFVHPNSILVVTINGIGFVFELVYLIIFYVYATNKGRKKLLLFRLIDAIFFTAIVLITMLALHSTRQRSLVVGVLCVVFHVTTCVVSRLTSMAKVIKTKNVECVPFWLSVANLLNGVCWTTYALIHPLDLYVLISNGIGAISALVQLILYACCCCNCSFTCKCSCCNCCIEEYEEHDDGADGDHVSMPNGVVV